MIILDTYDLGNGNEAQLIESDVELSCGLDVEPRYAIDIMNGIKMMSLIPFQANPLDAIFILMDLGLIEPDYEQDYIGCVARVQGKHYDIPVQLKEMPEENKWIGIEGEFHLVVEVEKIDDKNCKIICI